MWPWLVSSVGRESSRGIGRSGRRDANAIEDCTAASLPSVTSTPGRRMEHLWNRLNAMDFINKGMLFAAILLLCFFPFIIVANALAGQSAVTGLIRHLGLNQQAARDVSGLFASSSSTSNAVTGTAWLFFILGGIAAATAVQDLYERSFELESGGMKDIVRRIIWLARDRGRRSPGRGGRAVVPLVGWPGGAGHRGVGRSDALLVVHDVVSARWEGVVAGHVPVCGGDSALLGRNGGGLLLHLLQHRDLR